MKTLGEILTSTRKDRHLTLKEISKTTRIEIKHLKALEADLYHLLPPPTFTKGFIRNYAQILKYDPEKLIAIYRRDSQPKATASLSSDTSHSLKRPLLHQFSKSSLLLFISGFVVFFSYLLFQYRALVIPPPLEILQPRENAVVTSPVTIEGKSSSDSLITLNDDTDLSVDQSGLFLTKISLSPGTHQLKVVATNRFGKTAQRSLTFTVLSSD